MSYPNYYSNEREEFQRLQRRKRRNILIIIAILLILPFALRNVIIQGVDQMHNHLDSIYEVPELQYISSQERAEMIHSMKRTVSTQDLTRIGKEEVHIIEEQERKWYITWEDIKDYYEIAKDIVESRIEQSSND